MERNIQYIPDNSKKNVSVLQPTPKQAGETGLRNKMFES